MSVSNGRRGGKSVPRHGQIDMPNMLSEIIESHLSAPPSTQSSEAATLGGLDASAYVPYLNADKNVDLNGHNITGNSDGALSTPGDDTAVPSQKAVKTYVPNAPLMGLSVGAGTVTSASTIVQAMGYLEYRVALDDAKVTFPGFGTTHALAAYGDHGHTELGTTNFVRVYQNEPFVYFGAQISIVSPYETKSGTYKGSIHNHTTGSDGVDTPSALVTYYKNLGYDFVSITDHNVVTADPGVAGILFVPGVEESTATGHILSMDATSHVTDTDHQDIIDAILSQGAVPILAHPALNAAIGLTDVEISQLDGYAGIEVYNAYAPPENAESRWDALLTAGGRAYGTAVDDTHNASADAGKGWIIVFADSATKANIVESIKRGNFYASTGATLSVSVSGRVITATTGATAKIEWIGDAGVVLQTTAAGTSSEYTAQGFEKYIRIRITRASDGKFAWSNPIYVSMCPDRDLTRGGLIRGRIKQSVEDTSIENVSGYLSSFANNPSATCGVNKYALNGTHTIPAACAQNFTATQYGMYGQFVHLGSGTLSNAVGLRGRCTLSAGGGTNAYGGSNTSELTGATVWSGVVTGNHGAVSSQHAGATVAGVISGVWAELILNLGVANGAIASFYAGDVSATGITGTRPRLDGFSHGDINGTGFSASSMIHTGDVTGATTNRQLDLGAGKSYLSDTSEAVSATSASLGTPGGIYATKKIKTASTLEGASLSIGGVLVSNSTDCVRITGFTSGAWAKDFSFTDTSKAILGGFGGFGGASGGEPTLTYLWIGPAYNDTTWSTRFYPNGKVRVYGLTASRLVLTDANKDLGSLAPGSAPTAQAAAAPAGGTGTTAGAYDTAAHRDAHIALSNNNRTRIEEIYQVLKAANIMS